MAEIGRQLLARHRLSFAVDGERKRETVRDDVVQRLDCAAARDVLDVDDLFFWLRPRVRLKPANRFEVIPERAGSGHEPPRIVFIDALPPEVEKDQPVLKYREPLFDLGLKRTRGEVLRIF